MNESTELTTSEDRYAPRKASPVAPTVLIVLPRRGYRSNYTKLAAYMAMNIDVEILNNRIVRLLVRSKKEVAVSVRLMTILAGSTI